MDIERKTLIFKDLLKVIEYIDSEDIVKDSVKKEALEFALIAHAGKMRKFNPEMPVIVHSIEVANILKEYGADDHVIAAAYLHDVVEDTSFTIEDIENNFGSDIKDLVAAVTVADKSLTWEVRKQIGINRIKHFPLRFKLIECADKINNLEDLYQNFTILNREDYSLLKRGKREQFWYYFNIYKSLIHGEDPNNPLFLRLKDDIDKVFTFSPSKNKRTN